MTKSLTEKWKNGELKTGAYYIEWSYDCDPRPSYMIDFFDKEYNDGEFMLQRHKYIDEVLAPVPAYDEYKQFADLSKKVKTLKGLLEHALQTMGQIAKLSEDKVDAVQCATSICLIQERLKEMEGVK